MVWHDAQHGVRATVHPGLAAGSVWCGGMPVRAVRVKLPSTERYRASPIPRESTARLCIATTTCAHKSSPANPNPHPSSTRTSRRSLLADLANLRAHNERLRHQNTKLSERLSEVLGEQVVHDAGLTGTDEIGILRERVAELEQELLDRCQDLQDRDDELAASRAANRGPMTTLNDRTR
jgi:hypothetical protein